jgi:hypothetical protein
VRAAGAPHVQPCWPANPEPSPRAMRHGGEGSGFPCAKTIHSYRNGDLHPTTLPFTIFVSVPPCEAPPDTDDSGPVVGSLAGLRTQPRRRAEPPLGGPSLCDLRALCVRLLVPILACRVGEPTARTGLRRSEPARTGGAVCGVHRIQPRGRVAAPATDCHLRRVPLSADRWRTSEVAEKEFHGRVAERPAAGTDPSAPVTPDVRSYRIRRSRTCRRKACTGQPRRSSCSPIRPRS